MRGAVPYPASVRLTNMPRISMFRVTGAALLLITGIAALLSIARSLPDSAPGLAAKGAIGGITMLVAASVVEWLVHRYIYHRRVVPGMGRIYEIHEKGHHHKIFPTWRYTTNGTPKRHPIASRSTSDLHASTFANLGIKLAHFGFYLALAAVCVWLPAWLFARQLPLLFGQIAVTLVIADLFVRVHDAIHYPATNAFLRSRAWFRFLARHHYIHHVDPSANVNFLLPLGDLCFGTLRLALTEREVARHGSMEEATAVPIGWSEPALEVAAPRARA